MHAPRLRNCRDGGNTHPGWGKVVGSRLRFIHSNFKLIVFDLGGQIFSICPPNPPLPVVGYVVVQSEHNSVLRAKSSQDWRTCVRNLKLWVPCQAVTELIYIYFQICGCHISKTSKLWVPEGHGMAPTLTHALKSTDRRDDDDFVRRPPFTAYSAM